MIKVTGCDLEVPGFGMNWKNPHQCVRYLDVTRLKSKQQHHQEWKSFFLEEREA